MQIENNVLNQTVGNGTGTGVKAQTPSVIAAEAELFGGVLRRQITQESPVYAKAQRPGGVIDTGTGVKAQTSSVIPELQNQDTRQLKKAGIPVVFAFGK
ncbi:MAG: hypothetical protein LBH29_01935, partial [Elusimicrobiota bacterium]|nr:hypothetical protein [Elusimicrobiota bacterium]